MNSFSTWIIPRTVVPAIDEFGKLAVLVTLAVVCVVFIGAVNVGRDAVGGPIPMKLEPPLIEIVPATLTSTADAWTWPFPMLKLPSAMIGSWKITLPPVSVKLPRLYMNELQSALRQPD